MLLLTLESPGSTLEDLVYEFSKNECAISKQGLHKKFNSSAVNFAQEILSQLLANTFDGAGTCLEKLPFIKNVQVIDSSEIRLHKSLKQIFPQVRGQGAAVKLQSILNVLDDHILSLDIRPSKEPDQSYKEHIKYINPGDLSIADLGYFCIDTFSEIAFKGGFYLSRYFKKTNLYDLKTKELLDLRSILNQVCEEKIELEIALGKSELPCRLVAIKLTEEAYQQRLSNLEEKRRKDPRSKESQNDLLNQWTIFVTNLPSSVEASVLLQFYGLRWQIELLFKMMKTFLNLRKVNEVNQYRAQLSLYISLIAMTLLSLVAMTIPGKEISLYKASKLFVKNIRVFINIINNKGECVISWLANQLSKFALKESRSHRPSTKRSLAEHYA
jgi:hypothetical protein